jgi:hypothetical protein
MSYKRRGEIHPVGIGRTIETMKQRKRSVFDIRHTSIICLRTDLDDVSRKLIAERQPFPKSIYKTMMVRLDPSV